MSSSSSKSYWSIVLPIFAVAALVVGGLIFIIRWSGQDSSNKRVTAEQARRERVVADVKRLNERAQVLEAFDRLRQSIVATLANSGRKKLPQPSNRINLTPKPVTLYNFRNVQPERLAAANTLVVNYETFANLRYQPPAEVSGFSSSKALPPVFACQPCRNLILYEDREKYTTPDTVPAGVYGIPPETLQLIEQLRYVVVVRTLKYLSPKLSGKKSFTSGAVLLESTIWDANSGKLLGTLLSKAFNDKSVDFSAYTGEAAVGNDAQALNALRTQLHQNVRATAIADLTKATGGDFGN